MTLKRCTRCDVEKTLQDFNRRRDTCDGLRFDCRDCQQAASKLYNRTRRVYDPEKVRRLKESNPELARLYTKRFYDAHREQRIQESRAWARANPAKRNAKTARYKARKLQATVAWANKFFIEEIYDLARRRTASTGFKWHVDHIVPLQSKNVCGLHVENNLRVIPAVSNLSKHNRHWPDMPAQVSCQ